MKRTEDADGDCNVGFNTLICEEDNEHQPNQNRQQVSVSTVSPGRHGRQAAGILVLFAAVLLIVDISLGVHYNNLRDTHLTIQDVERIENELDEFQDIYKTAAKSLKDANKQLDDERSQHIQTLEELDQEEKRKETYEEQIATITNGLAFMRTNLLLISDGCRHCPTGWILMNSACYYFSSSNIAGKKTWEKAREFCQMYGGDLAIIDTRDKENSTITYLTYVIDSRSHAYWIGLNILNKNTMWTWVDGRVLVEGYWMHHGFDYEDYHERCAALQDSYNIFRTWTDRLCHLKMRWICEKAPTSPY